MGIIILVGLIALYAVCIKEFVSRRGNIAPLEAVEYDEPPEAEDFEAAVDKIEAEKWLKGS